LRKVLRPRRALPLLAATAFAARIVFGGAEPAAWAAPTPMAANLRVTVDGVTQAGGALHIGIYDEATFPALADIALFKRDIPKISGDVSVEFQRLPPGTYAIRAYQDVNGDGRWQMGEPRGISNGAAPGNFDAAAIVLEPGANMAAIHLR
jgi:uncharacterized protein (DUF2141 family)